MALFHKDFEDQIDNPSISFLPKKTMPSAFFLSRPYPEIFSILSPANLELLRIIQQFPELYGFLERLKEEWHVKTLMHGDISRPRILAPFCQVF